MRVKFDRDNCLTWILVSNVLQYLESGNLSLGCRFYPHPLRKVEFMCSKTLRRLIFRASELEE